MKALIRGLALRVPPIGRLYEYAMQQARENQERAATIAALTAGDEPHLSGERDSASAEKSHIRSNVEFWKELQKRDYFENHPCYNGLVDMGDSECGVIEWFLPLSKDMNAVVIGCGYGRETAHLAQRVAHVHGIDVNSIILNKAVRYLGEKGITNFTPVEAENYRQTIPQGVDLVFSIVVMQHLTRDLVRDYFGGLGSLLKPRGRMVVQFLEEPGAGRHTDAELKVYEPSVSWTIPEIVELCRQAGLRTHESPHFFHTSYSVNTARFPTAC